MPPKSYKKIVVITFLWEEDDIGVLPELTKLNHIFKEDYGFTTSSEHLIPSTSSFKFVNKVLSTLLRHSGAEGNLLIICYSGHGSGHKGSLILGPTQLSFENLGGPGEKEAPRVNWTNVQKKLENCAADVLIVMDCCEAVNAFPPSPLPAKAEENQRGRFEILGASGVNEEAPGPGMRSFLHLVTEELKFLRFSANGFEVGLLSNRVVWKIGLQETSKKFTPVRYSRDDGAGIHLERFGVESREMSVRGSLGVFPVEELVKAIEKVDVSTEGMTGYELAQKERLRGVL